MAGQIAELQGKLDEARERVAGTPQAQTLELAQQLLEISRARLLNESVADDGQARELISALMDRTQQRIDAMRIVAKKSSDAERLNAQLDQMQKRLDLGRQRFSGSDVESGSGPASPQMGREQIARIYAVAQQRLDEAYAKAAALPDSERLIEQLDTAQRRLDQARAGFEAQTAPAEN